MMASSRDAGVTIVSIGEYRYLCTEYSTPYEGKANDKKLLIHGKNFLEYLSPAGYSGSSGVKNFQDLKSKLPCCRICRKKPQISDQEGSVANGVTVCSSP